MRLLRTPTFIIEPKNQGSIKLGDSLPGTFSAQGISIDNNMAYAVGTIHVFFDVAEDFDVGAANVVVNEEIPAAASTEANEAEVTVLVLRNDEIEIRISDVHLDDEGKLVVPIEGLSSRYAWRDLVVNAVLDGETYFLEKVEVSNDSYTRTSNRLFETLPEQLILYEKDNEQDAVVFDVTAGVFVK